MRHIRGREIGFVPQSPVTSLNPALRIGTQLNEAWTAHANGAISQRRDRFLSLLDSVSLPGDDTLLRRHPGELSVGQAQRLLIAMSILHKPSLVIADEPTSALDVVTQSEILKLLARLNRDLNMAVLYISHDLLSVSSLCHRVAILHDGADRRVRRDRPASSAIPSTRIRAASSKPFPKNVTWVAPQANRVFNTSNPPASTVA